MCMICIMWRVLEVCGVRRFDVCVVRGRERSQEVERAATKGYARFAREVARGCERSRGIVGLFYASSARRVSRGVM